MGVSICNNLSNYFKFLSPTTSLTQKANTKTCSINNDASSET